MCCATSALRIPTTVLAPDLLVRLDHAAAQLVFLDGLEQGLEIALAKALVALALDDFKEDRADHRVGENLQEDAVIPWRAVDQQVQLAQQLGRFAMTGDAAIDLLVVGIRGCHELHAVGTQAPDGLVDIVGAQRDVLDALAVVFADEFLDLRLVVRRLVDRDADLAARRGHGAGEQTGELALDIEVANLAEVGDALVEAGPDVHLPATHVVGQVVDAHQAHGVVVGRAAFDVFEVDVIDRLVAITIDEVQQGAADALDTGDVQLAEVGVAAHQLGTLGFDVGSGLGGVLHAEGHGAGARPVLLAELAHMPGGAAVEHDIDVVLLEQPDLLGAMLGGFGKAHLGEQCAQLRDTFGGWRGELDNLEAVGADGVVLLNLGHGVHLASCCCCEWPGPSPAQGGGGITNQCGVGNKHPQRPTDRTPGVQTSAFLYTAKTLPGRSSSAFQT